MPAEEPVHHTALVEETNSNNDDNTTTTDGNHHHNNINNNNNNANHDSVESEMTAAADADASLLLLSKSSSNPHKRNAADHIDSDDNNNNNNVDNPATTSTTTTTSTTERPQKKFFRQRAHCNPLSHNDSFVYPLRPDLMDWTVEHYPNLKPTNSTTITSSSADVEDTDVVTTPSTALSVQPNVLDIGCGFGGLIMVLATILDPQQYRILGMEIRAKVTEYVRLRIAAARQEAAATAASAATAATTTANDNDNAAENKTIHYDYQNCSVLRTNAMKFLPHYFAAGTIEKIFFCFPDPHFKRKNHYRRIVSERLLTEYAYVLKPASGRLYCITDVEDLHAWHVAQCNAHPLFRRIPDEIAERDDPCVAAMRTATEEGHKVDREGRSKYWAVYQRLPYDDVVEVPRRTARNFFDV